MKTLLFILVMVIGLVGCGQSANDIGAPEIFYGQDVCDECSMIISDVRFAAATIDLNGNIHKFDDIGGMVVYHMDHPESQVRAYFVHDYNTQVWLRGETAYYVHSPQIQSPMNDGIAAFADEASAQAFAAQVRGTVKKFDELRVYVHLVLHSAP
ncbi:MAG: nitrous oxide reductase accessory protein NosL [Anaerolineae bacterium]|nr:nitrous oxide reductase accessory protein NosL [Anaerolineae bacterium]